MVLVWWVTDDPPTSPNFPPAKLSHYKVTQKCLLSKLILSLAKAIEIAQSVEAAEINLKGGATMDVMQVVPDPPRKMAEKKGTCKWCGNKYMSLGSVITKILNATSVTK